MKRTPPAPGCKFITTPLSFLVLTVAFMAFLFSMSSCDTGSKGPYKFQAKSMHWLQFRGPNGLGIALSADDFSVLAQNKLHEKIAASPVAVDDVLYIRTDKHLYAFRE